ncbi:MAG: uroporphyrinogen-III synthase [Bdellovibrionales bacterium]|nr:uroporphyrinogen-III synthase [Bdellovibrionales bacterium]
MSSGRLVLNTRPRGQAALLTSLLKERAFQVLEFPCVEIVPTLTPDELQALVRPLKPSDWIFFTSANAVTIALQAGSLGNAKVAAIGRKTAAALRDRGGSVDFVATEANSEALAAQFLAAVDATGSLTAMLLRGRIASSSLPDALAQAGVTVRSAAIYDSVCPSPAAELLAQVKGRLAEFDSILLTSSEAVRNLERLLGPGSLVGIRAAVIGAKTAATATALGMELSVVAPEASIESLVEVL